MKKNPAAVAMSKMRLVKVSPKRRKEIAAHANKVRWERVRAEAARKARAGKKAAAR